MSIVIILLSFSCFIDSRLRANQELTLFVVCDGACAFSVLAGKIYRDVGTSTTAGELVAIALAHAFSLFAAVSTCMNISGGHVNPAVTFGTLLGGRISVLRAVFYWVAQLLGAVAATLVLRLATNNMVQHSL